MQQHDVIVIGSGISGLSFAFHAAARGLAPLVLEQNARAGGCVHSCRHDSGFWLELGAHTAYNSYGGMIDIIEACGLRDHLLPRARVPFRLLVDGRLRSIPSELSFLRLVPGLLRFPFVAKQGKTVRGYYTGLVGERNYARVLGPMLSAVPCQNADAFPAEMLFKPRPRRKDMERSFTLEGGLGAVIDALVAHPGIAVQTGATVRSLAARDDGFLVTIDEGGELAAGAVALACPPDVAAGLVRAAWPELAVALERIGVVRVETVGVVLERERVPLEPVAGIIPIDGSFYSAVSRDTVPDPRHRGFAFHFGPGSSREERMARIAAALQVEACDLEVVAEVQRTLPAPAPGHAEIVAEIDRQTAGGRLRVTGNYFEGLAMEDCVGRSTRELATLAKVEAAG